MQVKGHLWCARYLSQDEHLQPGMAEHGEECFTWIFFFFVFFRQSQHNSVFADYTDSQMELEF